MGKSDCTFKDGKKWQKRQISKGNLPAHKERPEHFHVRVTNMLAVSSKSFNMLILDQCPSCRSRFELLRTLYAFTQNNGNNLFETHLIYFNLKKMDSVFIRSRIFQLYVCSTSVLEIADIKVPVSKLHG